MRNGASVLFRMGLAAIVLYLLIQRSTLAQPISVTRVLVAVPDAGPGLARAGFDAGTEQLLTHLGFRGDDRPRLRTCEQQPRIVVAGTMPTDSIIAFHNLLTNADRPRFQLYDNPIVSSQYGSTCPLPMYLGENQVRKLTGVNTAGLTNGAGVVVAIVDRGIDMTPVMNRFPAVKPNQTFSWPANATTIYGDHGTRCAYVAALAAPSVEIADVRIFGDAYSFEQAYDFLRTTWNANKANWKALVISTSWEFPPSEAVFRSDETLARGTTHPLSSAVSCLAKSGADVVFAAGNAGSCAASTNRMNGSITPPNSMTEVMTVAAVDGRNLRLGDSGQGGLAAPTKPDFSAYGSLWLQDQTKVGHTSIAAALAAGLTASVRSLAGWSASERSTAQLRKCFADHADKTVETAIQDGTLISSQLTAHSTDFGYGVIRLESVLSWKDECGNRP